MNCDRFHEGLEALLSGDLGDDQRQELLDHADRCEECATVLALCRNPQAVEDPHFVESVVGQTSGAVCSSVVEEMGDWLDGRLARGRAMEFTAHVRGCSRCSELAAAMRRCNALLPDLAEMTPDPNFTADVLMATLESASLWHVAWRRMSDVARGILGRPGFPLEASFAATVLLVILTATPLAPWPQLPARALAVVQTLGSESAELDPAGATWAGLTGSSATTAFEGKARRTLDAGRTRWELWHPRLLRVAVDLRTLGSVALHLDFEAWHPAAQRLGRDVKALGSGPEERPSSEPPKETES
jgi:anti-sigma factor RsiW